MNKKEFHCFGPPGTGKTTWLVRQIEKALDKYNPEDILVASFTRSAATELVRRGVGIPDYNIGTLHALCYRHFEKPKIAETRIKDFNKAFPQYEMDLAGSVDPDDPNNSLDGFVGDSLMCNYQILRAKMVPEANWPDDIKLFHKVWSQWCHENGLWDFTSLIETALTLIPDPPMGQRIGFFDEAQDFTTLEFALVRQWGQSMDKVVLVGDDDQAIYGFKGGDPGAFINTPIPEKNKIFLRKSYRLPQNVCDFSKRWIQRVESREQKDFSANEPGGLVEEISASYKNPDRIIDKIVGLLDASEIGSAMILGSCSYMLDQVKGYMKEEGIPFCNPYRIKRGDWNPLKFKSDKQRTGLRRLLDLFMLVEEPEIRKRRKSEESGFYPCFACDRRDWKEISKGQMQSPMVQPGKICEKCGKKMSVMPLWSVDEFKSFMELFPAKRLLKRGGKKALKRLNYPKEAIAQGKYNLCNQNSVEVFVNEVCIMEDGFCDLINAVWDMDLDTIFDMMHPRFQKSLEYPMKIAKTFGLFSLRKDPQILIGTVHSVKGGEADAVFLFPDLSPASYSSWENGGEKFDDIVRQFYVGMTRTRNHLYLCDPATNTFVDWG